MRALVALVVVAGCKSGSSPHVGPDANGGIDAPIDAEADGGIPVDGPPPPPPATCTGQTDPVIPMASSPLLGSTFGANTDTNPQCGDITSPVSDRELQLELPDLLTFQARLDPGSLGDVSLRLGRCDGGFVRWGGCDINAGPGWTRWSLNNSRAGTYFLVVQVIPIDPVKKFKVTVTGVIQPNGRCDVPLATSGALVCAPGTTCNGTACVSPSGECGDGIDNDGDGKNGYPLDPGCSSITDPTELDDCPLGPGCAACASPIDEDGDGLVGFPSDPGCTSPGDLDESDGCPLACPRCSNGYDDDFDNEVDLADSACSSAAWDDEYPES